MEQIIPAPSPTKTEFNTLNSTVSSLSDQIGDIELKTISHNINANSARVYSTTDIVRGILTVTGGNNNRCGAWLVYNAGNGFVVPLFDTSSYGSLISVTCDGTNVTVSNGSSSQVKVRAIVFTNNS